MRAQFRDALLAHLEAEGLSVNAAAALTGVPQSTLQGYAAANPTQPPLATAACICEALGMTYVLGPRDGRSTGKGPPTTQIDAWPVTSAPPDGSPSPTGCLWFTDRSLRHYRLCPSTITAVWLLDDSMEPLFLRGTGAVADTARRKWVGGAFYGIRLAGVGEDAIRQAREESGRRMLVARRRDIAAVPWAEDESLIGQIVWAGRFFVPRGG